MTQTPIKPLTLDQVQDEQLYTLGEAAHLLGKPASSIDYHRGTGRIQKLQNEEGLQCVLGSDIKVLFQYFAEKPTMEKKGSLAMQIAAQSQPKTPLVKKPEEEKRNTQPLPNVPLPPAPLAPAPLVARTLLAPITTTIPLTTPKVVKDEPNDLEVFQKIMLGFLQYTQKEGIVGSLSELRDTGSVRSWSAKIVNPTSIEVSTYHITLQGGEVLVEHASLLHMYRNLNQELKDRNGELARELTRISYRSEAGKLYNRNNVLSITVEERDGKFFLYSNEFYVGVWGHTKEEAEQHLRLQLRSYYTQLLMMTDLNEEQKYDLGKLDAFYTAE